MSDKIEVIIKDEGPEDRLKLIQTLLSNSGVIELQRAIAKMENDKAKRGVISALLVSCNDQLLRTILRDLQPKDLCRIAQRIHGVMYERLKCKWGS